MPESADTLLRHRVLKTSLLVARALARRPLSLYQLGRELRVSPRTARRYVYALQAAGIDVVKADATPGRTHRYRLSRTSWLAALDLPKD